MSKVAACNPNFKTIFSNFSRHVKESYVDQEFVRNEWPLIESQMVSKLAMIEDSQEFYVLIEKMINNDFKSHTVLITPQLKSEIEKQNEKSPEFLNITSEKWDGALYLKIPSFNYPQFSIDKIISTLGQLKKTDLLILDLRLNTGGSLLQVASLLGFFIGPEKLVARIKTRNWNDRIEPTSVSPDQLLVSADNQAEVRKMMEDKYQEIYTSSKTPLLLCNNMTILIGNRCFSAGEVFCQVMREYGRAKLIGAPTAGQVIAAKDDFDLGEGHFLLLPFAEIESAKGMELEGNPIVPDITHAFDVLDTELLSPHQFLINQHPNGD